MRMPTHLASLSMSAVLSVALVALPVKSAHNKGASSFMPAVALASGGKDWGPGDRGDSENAKKTKQLPPYASKSKSKNAGETEEDFGTEVQEFSEAEVGLLIENGWGDSRPGSLNASGATASDDSRPGSLRQYMVAMKEYAAAIETMNDPVTSDEEKEQAELDAQAALEDAAQHLKNASK
ncbi:MAG: hypothetical protein ACE5KS_09610 [Woeseiaceae bacterium]